MWREARSTVRRVVVSLLMLATLLTYAAPGNASLLPHRPSPVHNEQVPVASHCDGAAVTDRGSQYDACAGVNLVEDDACCSAVQCSTMHGGFLPVAVQVFAPRLDRSNDPSALVIPDGIGDAPALRPPSLIL